MAKKAGTRKAGSPARTRGARTRKTAPASRARGRKKAAPRAGARKKAVRKRPAGRRKPLPRAAARKAATRKRKVARKRVARAAARTATRKPAKKAGATRKPALRKAAAKPAPKPAPRPAPARTAASQRPAARPASPVRRPPALDRERRQLREVDENIPTPPSSLDMDRLASAARSGRHEMQEERREHHETSPVLTAGDVDADWEDAYAVGDEAPGGDNPTPDQDRVDDIGRALGVQYEDSEELKGADKIAERDKHRWELDPASSDDYLDRD